MMAASASALALVTLLGVVSAQDNFYGVGIVFHKVWMNQNGDFETSFYYRQNGRNSCGGERFFGGSNTVKTDQDISGQSQWCQAEGNGRATTNNKTTFSLGDSGCCWTSNVNNKTQWAAYAELDLGTRSDTNILNQPPITATVAYLRRPQNCFSSLPLLVYDTDNDYVRCRFAASASVDPSVSMEESTCTLRATGQLAIGVYALDVVVEDYPTKDVTLSYKDGTSSVRKAFNESSNDKSSPFSQVPLQFALEILPPVSSCVDGDVTPQFFHQTPSHGDLLHAAVGYKFSLQIEAEASNARIYDLQVGGPLNMTKEFRTKESGQAEVTLTWTPSATHLHHYVPLCLTAETEKSQSEMRCFVIMVMSTPALEGKGKVTCTANRMTILLEKNSMPDIDMKLLQLEDPSCSLTANETYIMGIMSLNTCGTKVEVDGEFIVFKNEINSFELANSVITRRRKVKIGFSCRFPKTMKVSTNYRLQKSDYIFTESSFGSFGYAFDIYKDTNFTQKVESNAYPVEVKLMEMIYMGIQAESDLPAVTLFVESCVATPDGNPQNSLFYNLIQNGCVKDETLTIHPSDPTSFLFEVQAFKFTGNFEEVYITCSVILCEAGNPNSRCAQGCQKNANSRRRRNPSRETASHSITQGPLRLVKSDDPGVLAKRKDGTPTEEKSLETTKARGEKEAITAWTVFGSNISAIIFGSLFIVMVLILALVVVYFTKKTKADDHKSLLVTEWEN